MTIFPVFQSEVDELMTNKNVVCVTPNPHRVINIVQFCAKFSAYEVSHMSDGIAIKQ